MARTRSIGGRRPRRAEPKEDGLENGHDVVEEEYEEVEEDSPVSDAMMGEPEDSVARDQKGHVNDVINEEVEKDLTVPDGVMKEPANSDTPDEKYDVVDVVHEEVQEASPVPSAMAEEPANSAAPDREDDANNVVYEAVQEDPLVPDGMKDEPANSAAPYQKDNGNDVVPMDEEAVKNEKKRGREGITLPDESEKISKAAKTEVAFEVEGLEKSILATKAEDEAEGELENGNEVEVVEGAVIGEESGKTKKLKKRKIAMTVAYCGAEYQGMQRNPGAITIEGELEQALYRAGAITKDNFGVPRKIDWMRAARTDKGVSAIGQVVSGQFIIEPEGFVERVNSFLPRDIVVLGYKRVTGSFNAKKHCDKRRYEYIIPTYCFDPSKHLDRESAGALKSEDNQQSVEDNAKEVKDMGESVDTEAFSTKSKEESLDGETGLPSKLREEHVDGETGLPSKVVGGPVDGETVIRNENKEELKPVELPSKVKEEAVSGETVIPNENKEVVKSVKGETAYSDKGNEEHADEDTVDPVRVKEESVNEETILPITGKEGVNPIDGNTSARPEVKKYPYEFDEAEFIRLNRILARYKGTHNYHNFTARTQAEDPSAKRYIICFEAEDVITIEGIDFVRCHVVGQSFMLHQIRKMIGLAVAIMRGAAPESVMDFALRKDTKFNVPMAPELGLFLEECYYSSYNKKFQSSHEEFSLRDYKDAVNDFKKNVIYPHIASTEARDKVFPMWLHGINDRHYPDFVAAREGTYKPGNRVSGNAA